MGAREASYKLEHLTKGDESRIALANIELIERGEINQAHLIEK